jgi:hypothetical protein
MPIRRRALNILYINAQFLYQIKQWQLHAWPVQAGLPKEIGFNPFSTDQPLSG